MISDHIHLANEMFEGIAETGSYHMCDPAIVDTDIDYLVLTINHEMLSLQLMNEGFVVEGDNSYGESEFESYRRGNMNILVNTDKQFFSKWQDATRLCTKLNLSEKKDRIALFQYILYGNI